MIEFQSAFMESNVEPIKYKGKTLIMADEIPVNKEFKITLKLISKNSKR